ncbi:hypothetical protein AAY473_027276, partial [Plecturocebus cupreus]
MDVVKSEHFYTAGGNGWGLPLLFRLSQMLEFKQSSCLGLPKGCNYRCQPLCPIKPVTDVLNHYIEHLSEEAEKEQSIAGIALACEYQAASSHNKGTLLQVSLPEDIQEYLQMLQSRTGEWDPSSYTPWRLKWLDHLSPGVPDQPGQCGESPSLQKTQKLARPRRVISAHYNFHLLGSSDPPVSAPQVAGITDMHHHTQIILFFVETGFQHVAQACLKLLSSGDSPPRPPIICSQFSKFLITAIPNGDVTGSSTRHCLIPTPRLVCSGTVMAHGNPDLLGSNSPLTSVFQVARTTGTHHCTDMVSLCCPGWSQILDISCPSTLASQSAEITGTGGGVASFTGLPGTSIRMLNLLRYDCHIMLGKLMQKVMLLVNE